ncbi:alpha/beta hydrolase [Noviherbaspirillum sp. CPCC 100848]|uniref:Alpha/beta hydrolase n=1 Tax=Noviherbaspirillum album TaxID=3080276 RepID=A0ABU6J6Z3_9BURK|nr:alpha/beta hydrolase [Noviherbaspirillum sp. CPCC 100848]MEC4719409.1 alpha/beta hydrolase [Noviherbaspirillum sp. CPCC 100848]
MPVIETNGIQLAYDVQGNPEGETIVLIAGLGLQLISWPEKFCQALVKQGFRVVRFDNRDSGLSSKMNHFGKAHPHLAMFKPLFGMPMFSSYTLYDMARDTIGLMNALGIEKAHIVGASMGGMIAQIIAARYPERMLTLTSIMSTSGRPGLPGPSMAASTAMLSTPSNPRDFASVVEYYVHLFQILGSPAYPTPEAVLRQRIMQSVRRNPSISGTSRQMMAVASTGDLVAQLRTIRAPALIIHGTDDPLVPVACGRDSARWIPNAILHEIEGMGHDIPPQLEVPIANLIASHCRRELTTAASSA